MNPPQRHPQSGYNNAVKSPPMVGYNGFARPITIKEVNGKPFTWVTAQFTGAWQNDLSITVIGRLNGVEKWRWEDKTCTECHVAPEDSTSPAPIFEKVDEVTIISTAGIEDPAYPRGSGSHVAIENMRICAPRHEEREILAKRSVHEEVKDADDEAASDGPMKVSL